LDIFQNKSQAVYPLFEIEDHGSFRDLGGRFGLFGGGIGAYKYLIGEF
jgi:hypothetical protein